MAVPGTPPDGGPPDGGPGAEQAPADGGAPAERTSPDGEPSASRTAHIVPGPGGVMTDEVGVVTGELTLRTELHGDQVLLRVQYKEAAEWYVVTGGRTRLSDPADLDAVHTIAVGLLDRPDG